MTRMGQISEHALHLTHLSLSGEISSTANVPSQISCSMQNSRPITAGDETAAPAWTKISAAGNTPLPLLRSFLTGTAVSAPFIISIKMMK